MIGSAVSNPIEVMAVCKQADPSITLRRIISETDSVTSLMTRGLGARVSYHSTQSVVVWLLIHYIGKAFNVDLNEIA